MKRTLFIHHSPLLRRFLPDLHAAVRCGAKALASEVYAEIASVDLPEAEAQVDREAQFLQAVDASLKVGAERSRWGQTPRDAFLRAALVGWKGDELSAWSSPVDRETLIAWAASHYGGPQEDLVVSLDALELQGLFFAVHPSVFETPCYYCTFDPAFLDELSIGTLYKEDWGTWQHDYDASHGLTWRSTGLCTGQGSQGPSDVPMGPCLGASCGWLLSGKDRCLWDLTYRQISGRAGSAQTVELGPSVLAP